MLLLTSCRSVAHACSGPTSSASAVLGRQPLRAALITPASMPGSMHHIARGVVAVRQHLADELEGRAVCSMFCVHVSSFECPYTVD